MGLQRIFDAVFRGAKGLTKAQSAKVVYESTVIGFSKKCYGFRLRLAKVHSAEGANAFTQFESAAGVLRNLLIDVAEPLEIGWIGDENPGYNPRAGRIANRILTHR